MEVERTKFDFLLMEIAEALNTHFESSKQYLNITRAELVFISDVSFEQDIFPEDGDELLYIEPLPSHELFRIMEDYAESIRDEQLKDRLFRTLGRSHPFSRFRDEVYDSEIEKDWFAYQEERMKGFAQNWLKENEVEYKDDCLVCHSNLSFIFDKEAYIEEENDI